MIEKQLELFALYSNDDEKKSHHLPKQQKSSSKSKKDHWTVYVDGAARGNPGFAGAGIKIIKNDKTVLQSGAFLGKKTNNQAEYLALALAIFLLKKELDKESAQIHFISDSELLVKQMNGDYKVKNEFLILIKNLITELLDDLKYKFSHVVRSKNTDADLLANKAIDSKQKIPISFVNLLHKHGIQI